MTEARTFSGLGSTKSLWVDLIRANCLTLVERPDVANAVSISRAFRHGAEEEREAVITLAQRMAEEYHLLTEVSLRGYFLTIRFSRKDESSNVEWPSGASMFGKVRSLLSPHHAPLEAQSNDDIRQQADHRHEVRS